MPAPLNSKRMRTSLAPHGKICERICEQFVEVHVPPVAEQVVAHVVAVSRGQCACLLRPLGSQD